MIEDLITHLVQQAPARDPETIAALEDALLAHAARGAASDASPLDRMTRGLALAIRRIVELVAEELVDPGIALPALAEACATLVSSRDARVLEAARYQVDTLQPQPRLITLSPRRQT